MSADSTTASPLTPTPLPLKWTKKEREEGKGRRREGGMKGGGRRKIKGKEKQERLQTEFSNALPNVPCSHI